MSDEPFLARWSRLKRGTATVEPVPEALPEPLPEETLPVEAEPTAEAIEVVKEDPLEDLPSIEDLTADSDFTPFLRAEVPEDLHRQALRKLWTSDPIYANDDGLKDYADDYTGLFNLSEPIKTLYRVGKGFLDDDVEEAPDATLAEGIPSPPPGRGAG